ncbi:hypothetical protein ASPZODRAFT_25624 [Penicilliopsis zonata CBS 506.65]|uniref:Uncharacterized protein n=1 Tax=Penicilliopsis zonata CBS 506.65 TaxID=1073090 RepID=A0A1L9SH66_9EURO|nr:hypothetical protein ASPZODRAFT_25624 [Penicilliopsis zonata CBS 506.65]OJJ46539.1 hypothetical protein ASPZODRAFT_25624 [Penicilliopsis zonata CBS 506.65]
MDTTIPETALLEFDQNYAQLKKIHESLRHVRGSSIPEPVLQEFGIALHSIDVDSGLSSSSSGPPYFLPSPDAEDIDQLCGDFKRDIFVRYRQHSFERLDDMVYGSTQYQLLDSFLQYQKRLKDRNIQYLETEDNGDEMSETDSAYKSGEDSGNEAGNNNHDNNNDHNHDDKESSEWDSGEESDGHISKEESEDESDEEQWYNHSIDWRGAETLAPKYWVVTNYYDSWRQPNQKAQEGHHAFRQVRRGQATSPYQGHRWAVIMTDESDDDCPSVTELLALVNEILKAMSAWKKKATELENSCIHRVFPVAIISYDKYLKVRVLHGYYYDGTLNVQFTEVLDFFEIGRYAYYDERFNYFLNPEHEDEYCSLMGSLTRWTWPLAQGDTTQPVSSSSAPAKASFGR